MTKTLKINKQSIKNFAIDILHVVAGCFISAMGFKIFLSPNNILPGGFTGLSQIIRDTLARINFTAFSISTWYIILNTVLFALAIRFLGMKFTIRAGIGILSYSGFIALIDKLNFAQAINEQFIAESQGLTGVGLYILFAIFGGVLSGIGAGLVFRGNASTGGGSLIAKLVNHFKPTMSTGQILITVDAIVVTLSAISYNSLILPLYALITIFISGKVSDIVVDGVKSVKAFYIITSKNDEISHLIFKQLNRGATNINCEGMFTHESKDMLLVLVPNFQVSQLKKIVKYADKDAFMFCHNIKEVYGAGFIALNNKKIKKKLLKKSASLLKENTENINQVEENKNVFIENYNDNKITEIKDIKTNEQIISENSNHVEENNSVLVEQVNSGNEIKNEESKPITEKEENLNVNKKKVRNKKSSKNK